MSAAEIIDRSADTWHVRVRQYLLFQVKWHREGHPSHWFRTRDAAVAAIAAAEPFPTGLTRVGERILSSMEA